MDMDIDVHCGRFQMVFYLLVLIAAFCLLRECEFSSLYPNADTAPPC